MNPGISSWEFFGKKEAQNVKKLDGGAQIKWGPVERGGFGEEKGVLREVK